MYWSSPLVAEAVTLGLVAPRPLGRLARRVRRRAGDLPSCDLIWAEELVRSRYLTRYQAGVLLDSAQAIDSPCPNRSKHTDSPLKIGPYVVLDRVGRSDLGATYRCRRPDGRDAVAIKLLEPQWASSDEARARLADAVEGWGRLNDPRVLSADSVESGSGTLALAARWVAGVSPADWLRAGRRLSPVAAGAIIRELIAILARADSLGLVHGDLKPSNLLLTPRGEIRLIDSGVRRAVTGGPLHERRDLPPRQYDYVAPEVAGAEAMPDASSDIYSIGCLLYHLITGRPAFFGGNAERKCAAHRAGRVPDPRSMGIEIGHEMQLILQCTVQADRSRRADSYNDLLSRLSPSAARGTKRVNRELRRACRGTATAVDPASRLPGTHGVGRWSKWLVWTAAAVATVVAVLHGSVRLMPLLSLRASTRSQAIVRGEAGESSARTRPPDRTAVTALWNATDDLRRAFRDAAPHDTITLKSPGPFLLDAVEINKPVTLRGADDVRPLFLGGPGAALRIAASDVRLENVHFLRVSQAPAAQRRRDASAMVEVFGDRLALANCSFQDVGTGTAPASAISWELPSRSDEVSPATMEARNVWFQNVGAAVSVIGPGGLELVLENCLHFGPGPLVQSTSGAGKAFEGLDLVLSHVTVYGATAVDHSFPHPLDEIVPLRIVARDSYLVPQNREQPVLAVRYAVQPAMLMPKVSWSGSGTVCPADATMLEVTRGSDASPWRAADIAAWQKYWGTHSTGILGARLPFAAVLPAVAADLPMPTVTGLSKFGADCSQLWFPSPVALDHLPLMIERLRPK